MAQLKRYHARNLPPWHPEKAWVFVTFSLFGVLPAWKRPDTTAAAGESFRRMDRALDAATRGPDWLKDPGVSEAVVATILAAQADRGLCKLGAFVVMRNHAHILIQPTAPVAEVMTWIKGTSARKANEILERSGQPFWRHESYDHWARNSDDYCRIVRYIEWNPVKAGLVDRPEMWPWSSACGAYEQAKPCSTTYSTNGLKLMPRSKVSTPSLRFRKFTMA